MKMHASDLMAEQEQLNNTVSDMSSIVGTSIKTLSSMVDPETLADIEKGEQAANDAEAEYRAATQ